MIRTEAEVLAWLDSIATSLSPQERLQCEKLVLDMQEARKPIFLRATFAVVWAAAIGMLLGWALNAPWKALDHRLARAELGNERSTLQIEKVTYRHELLVKMHEEMIRDLEEVVELPQEQRDAALERIKGALRRLKARGD